MAADRFFVGRSAPPAARKELLPTFEEPCIRGPCPDACGPGSVQLSSVQPLSRVRSQGLQHDRPPCPSPTSGVYLKLMSIESVMPSNHLIFGCPLLLLPSIFPSIRVFSDESVLRIRWPKHWSFSISPSNEHSGLISFRMDWLHLHLALLSLNPRLPTHCSSS